MRAEILRDTLRAILFATMETALRQEDSLQKLRASLVRMLESSQPASCDAVAGIACRTALPHGVVRQGPPYPLPATTRPFAARSAAGTAS